MIFYLDASIFATLPLADAGWKTLEGWLSALIGPPPISDLTWGEFVSAVAARVRRREASAERATELLVSTDAWCAGWDRLPLQPDDIGEATLLVAMFDLNLRLPDALHIVIARRSGRKLVTADRQQARAAATLGHAVLNPLAGEPNS